ncbi:MAG: hypothetical protein AAF715_18970, partial [Myxococcota bacterium]
MARRCVSCFACWLLVLITVGTTGCATLVPFTHQMRVDNDLSADEVAQLQFYTSHDIALRREVTSKARRIDEGALQLRSGTRVERVLIPARTAGVVVAVDPDAIEVSFEPGTSIRFVVSGAERPMGVRPSSFAEPPPAPPLSPDARRIREAFGDLAGNYFLGEDDGRLSFDGPRGWCSVAPLRAASRRRRPGGPACCPLRVPIGIRRTRDARRPHR